MSLTTIEKNLNKYDILKNENFERMDLLPDEQIVHCIDENNVQHYFEGWLVTNKGRGWSLTDNRWFVPWMNENGYWRIANAYVHQLVCHYFMSDEDKRILKLVEEHNKNCAEEDQWSVEVHHKKPVEKIDYINMTDEEKMLACMAVNNKENLVYQIKKDHSDVHKIAKGNRKLGKNKDGNERNVIMDSLTSTLINSGASVHFSYDENGKKEMHTRLTLPTLTPEEEMEYEEQIYSQSEKDKEILMLTV